MLNLSNPPFCAMHNTSKVISQYIRWCWLDFTLSRHAKSFYCSIVTQMSFVLSPWLIWSPALSNRQLLYVIWHRLDCLQCKQTTLSRVLQGNHTRESRYFWKQSTLSQTYFETRLYFISKMMLSSPSPVTQSSLALNSITEAKRSKNVLVPKQRSLSLSVLRPEQAACISQNLCHNALQCVRLAPLWPILWLWSTTRVFLETDLSAQKCFPLMWFRKKETPDFGGKFSLLKLAWRITLETSPWNVSLCSWPSVLRKKKSQRDEQDNKQSVTHKEGVLLETSDDSEELC